MPGAMKCHTIGCAKGRAAGAVYRGLCLTCYSEAKKLIESKQTTWDKLAETGLCLAEFATSPFLKMFKERNANNS